MNNVLKPINKKISFHTHYCNRYDMVVGEVSAPVRIQIKTVVTKFPYGHVFGRLFLGNML